MTQPAPPTAPVCPRHPDRESHTRCQRCGRPACWECQRPAAVGFQCVDCVREQSRTARPTMTVLGGRAGDGRPVVTITVIAVCVVVYVLQQAQPQLTSDYAFAPAVGWSQPWRALTSALLHASLLHIGSNMLSLWFIGPYVESLLGRARYAALLVLGAFGGSLGLVLLTAAPSVSAASSRQYDGGWFTGAVGASGAIMAVFAAIIVLNRHLGRQTVGLGLVILLNVALPIYYPGIAWQAHVGGAVTGAALAGAVAGLQRPDRRRWIWPAIVVIGALLVAVYVARYLMVDPTLR